MTTRVDSWIWAIRLTKTRSAAGAACRAGHVRVNSATAKPSTAVAVGDEVRVRLGGRERVVEVTRLISKRVSAPMAGECYIDNSPPPPPRELAGAVPQRDRGTGRPTKRDRRDLEKLRMRSGFLVASAALLLALATGCSGDDDNGSDDPARTTAAAAPGPFFGPCGGVTVDDVSRITGFAGLTQTVNNTSACEWDASADRTGKVASFNWYRGSPIGREEANVKLSRATAKNIEINGHKGFIGYDQTQGICEIGIGFGGDFFEWSVSAAERGSTVATLPPIDTVCDSARQLAGLVIERAS
ncbi:DUF3558 domain-containing protein [Gordonia pseudamarae]|uniref:DUF3558 domain-containing protein n=1 Tax=Gordonia pseudamarae TaxID=2831662 RepID=A0ABX6IF29_9ACTN|nr:MULTISPECIES: DUF3558 family protein [Gordonia]MBD0023464.1 DUF3558 family protein [Gordonia sp. (in: high G+C Gram-positive bacteria)]QHN25507.1 DUF3558 domain-containing protein [Gordonia pseudamarae]QHN34437.1 DUF3558 domain-containing protein [Gordonia pseudamarae]